MSNPNRHPEGAAGSMGGKFAPDPDGARQAPVTIGYQHEAAQRRLEEYADDIAQRLGVSRDRLLVELEPSPTGGPGAIGHISTLTEDDESRTSISYREDRKGAFESGTASQSWVDHRFDWQLTYAVCLSRFSMGDMMQGLRLARATQEVINDQINARTVDHTDGPMSMTLSRGREGEYTFEIKRQTGADVRVSGRVEMGSFKPDQVLVEEVNDSEWISMGSVQNEQKQAQVLREVEADLRARLGEGEPAGEGDFEKRVMALVGQGQVREMKTRQPSSFDPNGW